MGKDKKKLFEDDDSEEEVVIKTQNEYAKKYDVWRGKEEIHKLEQKYGPNVLNTDGSLSSDSDDDEPPEVTEEMEKQFLKTLALLKTKDPRIYNPEFEFFENEVAKKQEPEKDKKVVKFEDSDEDSSDDDGNIFKIEKKALESSNSGKDKKERKNSVSKETNIKDFLTGKLEHIDDPVEKDLEPLKALWSNPGLNEGEAFLRDYILNKRYLEEGDVGEAAERLRDDEALEEDDATVEEQGKFERAYNFRFEEPDDEYLKRYPRTMNAVRPKDERRAKKRAEVRTRKDLEKQRKMEEIARLKALKLKEIQEKMERIKEVTGNKELAFREEDLESDFDPAEHDRRMAEMFNDNYYGEADDKKPQFPELDEELEIENWEKYETGEIEKYADNATEPNCEDEDFNMDADYDPKRARNNLMDEIKGTLGKKRRNRRKKSKLSALLETEKPKYIPTEDTTYSQFMEEYYKMDCEDVIAGEIPTRFKYRPVVANDYGLTIEEILLADDRELTQWAPIKKIVKHRQEAVEKSEVNTYRQKASDVNLKKKILPSLFKDLPEEPEVVVPVQDGKKKKKKNKITTVENKIKDSETSINKDSPVVKESVAEDNKNDKKKRKKNKTRKDSLTFEVEDLNKEIPVQNPADGSLIKSNQDNTKEPENSITPTKNTTANGFTVENVDTDVVSTKSDVTKNKRKETKHVIDNVELNVNRSTKKHKLDTSKESNQVPHKKKKHKNFKGKIQNKQEDKSSDPMGKLSDERLKAYGLNPKKYRGFLKYKKF